MKKLKQLKRELLLQKKELQKRRLQRRGKKDLRETLTDLKEDRETDLKEEKERDLPIESPVTEDLQKDQKDLQDLLQEEKKLLQRL